MTLTSLQWMMLYRITVSSASRAESVTHFEFRHILLTRLIKIECDTVGRGSRQLLNLPFLVQHSFVANFEKTLAR